LILAQEYCLFERSFFILKNIFFKLFSPNLSETMGLKIPDEELDVYFHRLPKPFSKQNFETVFRGYLVDTSPYSEDAVF